MAGRFFNQKVKKKKTFSTNTLVIGIIIAILLVIAIGVSVSVMGSGKPKNAVIEMREDVAVEVNSELPDKTTFFKTLENVSENDIDISFDSVDLTNIGEYPVNLKIYKKNYKSTLRVVDTESPILNLKDLTIPVGGTYKAEDFVDNCTDNSNGSCDVKFYNLGVNQAGESIDYSKYSAEGSYEIQIVGYDSSGNETTPQSAILYIGNSVSAPHTCNYGGSEYDTSKYILAVNVTENGCAIDKNLYQDPNILAPVNNLINQETEKLKKEFSKLNLNTKDVYLNSDVNPVVNTTDSGLVGYTLFMEMSIINSKGEKEIVESYHVTLNGTRQYVINKYLQ